MCKHDYCYFDPCEEELFTRFREAVKAVKIKDGEVSYLSLQKVKKAYTDFLMEFEKFE